MNKSLSKQEKDWLLQIGQGPITAYPKNKSVVQLFEEIVAAHAHRPAVSYAKKLITYAELNQKANQLAHYLQAIGIKKGTLVGMSCERSLDMMIGILAILKTGAVYAPIDPHYPLDRQHSMIKDAEISFLLTQERFKSGISSTTVQLVCLDTEKEAWAQTSTENLAIESSPEEIAYVCFTSGSTGKPKGVKIPHRAMIRLVRNTQWMAIYPEDRVLQFQNISFDVSSAEIWGALLNGAHLHLYPTRKNSIAHLANFIAQHEMTVLFLTSPIFNLLMEEHIDDLRHVRLLTSGGETMSPRHARLALEGLPSCQIMNGYGPTENTTLTTIYVLKDLPSIAHEVPIGTPISNTAVYILNEQHELVPQGAVGELYTGGDGLSTGYLDAQLTVEKFIPNPFGEGLLYRTGDLACFDAKGQILYRGRMDNQVKIRGFRIELEDIESALRVHVGVADCAVMVKEKQNQLIAYVQPSLNDHSDETVFRNYLSSKLPDYMVPSRIICLPNFPLTPNGKVDRKALLALKETPHQIHSPCQTEMEILVAALWQELFGWSDIGRETHFFKMGGNSLGVMKVISKLRKSFHVDVSIDLLFQYPVLAEFAEKIHLLDRSKKQCILSRMDTQIPLSYNQEALWIEDRFFPGSTHYAIPIAFQLHGHLDRKKLQHALKCITQNHEILRTRYHTSGKPIIEDKVDTILHWHQAGNKEEAMQWMHEKALVPFNLETGPVITFNIVEYGHHEYLALFYAHHIVIDDFSIQQFIKELAQNYTCTDMIVPAIQYSDFAGWQREFLKTDVAQQQLKYWKQQLDNAPELLELPWDKPRPQQGTHRGATHKIELHPSMLSQLEEFAKSQGVSSFTILLAMYFVLLYRYSGKEDILVGTPFANRNQVEFESLIGFCSQMMVIRGNLSQNPQFSVFIQQINRLLIEAQKNVDIPFEKLIAELNPSRNPSYNPLFQVGFTLENVDDLTLKLEGIEIERVDISNQASKFDLFLTVKQSKNALSCHLEYSTDLFEQKTIERLLMHYATLLSAAIAQPNQHVANIPILTKNETVQILGKWNQTEKPYAQQTIFRRFEAIAAQYPHHQAVYDHHQSIDYQTLNQKANQLARHLQTLGIKKGSCVGVSFDRSTDLVLSILAILKSGAVFVPIDPSYPAERRNTILEDANIEVVMTQSDYQHLFVESIVCIPNEIKDAFDVGNLSIDCEFSDRSHIFYTSGSTGKPKGVQLTHQGVVCLTTISDWFAVKPQDRVLQFSNISFDLMILEIFGALLNGGTLCIYPDKQISLTSLGSFLVDACVTHAVFTPRVLNLLVEDQMPSLKGLRFLVSAGEAMSVHHAKLARDALPQCQVVNGYGPTETNFATTYTLSPHEWHEHAVPIGKPLDNATAYLLNDFLQPVPIGVIGELYLGGDGVSLGYQNRPDLTDERFIPNPFGSGKLYRTGDLCRWLDTGDLIFIARKDTQVKVRGFRIELGEVEEVLRSHPQVSDCVVLVKDDSLIAYLVDGPTCFDELTDYAASKLPVYMVPSAFTTIDAIPLTSNGKVDVKKLPIPTVKKSNSTENELKTDMEHAVSRIWSTVLNVTDIQAGDNFFKLGGSSIHAIHVTSLLIKELKLDVQMNFLFQHPVLKDFALHLQQLSNITSLTKITKRTSSEPVRIPWNQESFWQIDLMIPNSSNYTMVVCFELEGHVQLETMEKAFTTLINRHEALRTRFEDKGDYRILVVEEGKFDMFYPLDLSNEVHAEEKAMEYLEEVFATPFDLQKLPLIQLHLIKTGPQKFLGALYVHHIVFDGWSIDLFFKELRTYYNAYLHDLPINEAAPLIQHADFVCWQHEFFKSAEGQRQIQYWKEQIQGTRLIELPTDFPRAKIFKGGGDVVRWFLPEQLSADLKKTVKELGFTLYELFLAAYKVLLHQYSGQNDLLVGSPFSNRTQEEMTSLLGFFIHMFAIRTQLQETESISAFVSQVSKKMANAYQNSRIPCEAIFAELYPDWNPSFNRFQVGFSLDSIAPSTEDFEGIKTTVLPKTNAAGKFDFYMGTIAGPKVIYLNMYYCTDLYLKETVVQMMTSFQTILEKIVQNPYETIDVLIHPLPKTPLCQTHVIPKKSRQPSKRTQKVSRELPLS